MPDTSIVTQLARALRDRGCAVAYGVTGAAIGRFTAAADVAGIRVVHPRHEAGAGFMATEHSLASGAPTVVFTTSGPGLSNALTGLVAAAWEGAHVVAVVGGTPPDRSGRFPFQRTDPHQLAIGSWLPPEVPFAVTSVRDRRSLVDGIATLDRALAHAVGSLTVFLLPTDTQLLPCDPVPQPAVSLATAPDPAALREVRERLSGRRVLVWVGHHARHEPDAVRSLVDQLGAAVVVTPRGKGIVDERDPRCLGVLGLGGARGVAERVQQARPDIALVLGARLSEFTSWWDDRLVPPEGFVHLGPCGPGEAFPGARQLWVEGPVAPLVRALHGVTGHPVAPSEPLAPESFPDGSEGLHPAQVMAAIQGSIVDRGIPVISEAGNAFAWATRVLRHATPTYRVSPDFGAMGQASAGVVGLALARGGRAVAVLGDGAMLMNTEISTAVAERAGAVWVVLNDAAYGMIAHGMAAIGLPPVATAIPRVDFVAFARAQGAEAVAADDLPSLRSALDAALAARGPFVIDVRVDPRFPPPFGPRNDALNAPQERRWRG